MTTPFPDSAPTGAHTGPLSGAAAPPPGCPAHVPAHASSRAPSDPDRGPGGVVRLYGPTATADPMGVYERLRAEHGAIAPVLLEGDVPAWLVLGYDEILRIARNPRRFARDTRHWRDRAEGRVPDDSPLMPVLAWRPDCISQDGHEHRRLRGAVKDSLESFDRRAIRRHVHRRSHQLVDGFAGAGHVELVGRFAELLPMMVLTDLFGLPDDEGARLVEASRQLVKGTEKALEADRHIHEILGRLVVEKHRAPGPDLASWLIAHEANLDDEEIRQHLRLVLVLANETTTNLMVNTLRMVLTDPRFRGTLDGGRMTLQAAVEQILWDEPPLMVLPGRFPTHDMEIAGREVREGDLLLLCVAAGNVDPAIGRTAGEEMYGNRSHLAFNSGPHECPGQDIGRAVTGSGIETLLARLPDLRLAVPEDELTWTATSWSRRLDALPVRFTPRHARNPFAPPPAPRSDTVTATGVTAAGATAAGAAPASAGDTAPAPRQRPPRRWRRLVRPGDAAGPGRPHPTG